MTITSVFFFSAIGPQAWGSAGGGTEPCEEQNEYGQCLPRLAGGAASAARCPQIAPAITYSMTQSFFAFGTDFYIYTSAGQLAGWVGQRNLHWSKTFDLYNEKNEFVARAREQAFTWGVKIDVTDCEGRPLGSIQENIISSLFKTWSTYTLYNANERAVGQSKKLEYGDTSIVFFTKSDGRIAEAYRPWANFFRDHWEVRLSSEKPEFDSRIVFFVPAFKSTSDAQRAASGK